MRDRHSAGSAPVTLLTLAACIILTASRVDAGKFNSVLSIGDQAPPWSQLQGTDGKRHSLKDYAKSDVLVIAFTCNHCPVAQAYEPRMKELVEKYRDKSVAVVAINCSLEPADSFEKMQERAREQAYNFDYLIDPSQDSGRTYGASVTPHLFVLDKQRKVAYMGAFDDSFILSRVEEHYVDDAVAALLAGNQPEVTESRQKGCSISYERKTSLRLLPEDDRLLAQADPPGRPVARTSDITLVDLDPAGFSDELRRHRGRVVLVDFWATWCLPCRKAFPHTVELHNKHARQGLSVISISLDDGEKRGAALEFLKKNKASFRNLLSTAGAEDEAIEKFQIDGGAIPHYKVYDRQGRLLHTFGFDFEKPIKPEEIEQAITAALARRS